MDHPNGTKTYITDGEVPLSAPPPVVGSPASLMAPDRYEFYSFGKDGELVKKLMTLDQIQGLIAGGDELLASAHGSPAYTQGQAPGVSSGGPPTDFYQQPLVQAGEPEGVNKVLESVQNVLKSELQTAHVPDHVDIPPIADDSWSILLPGFLNGELDFKEPIKPTIRPFNVTKLPPVTFPPTTPPSAPPRFTSTPSSTVSNPFQPVKMTTPRRPFPSSQTPFRPPTKATSTKPPIQSTTVKYSAHYTTTPPNAKPKPAAVVKKPTSPQIKPVQPVKPSTRPYNTSSPNLTATESTRNNFTVTAVRPLNSTMLSTTYKPTTAKGTTEKSKPSGIPTITHYLPIQSSINPSDAVKTTKPAVPTKPTTKTTPKPAAKPLKPYSKPQPAATTNQNSRPPTLTTTTTEEPPIAEKLVQRQPPSASLQSATSDMISVSVSTPSGPPSTLKMTAGTTVRPSRPTQPAKPGPSISKTPTVAIQPNKTKTTTSKPLTTQVKKEPVKYKPRPTPSVSVSSVATHKPVLVMNSKPVKQTENVLSAPLVSTTWAPLGSSTKQTTLTTKYTNNFNNKGSYTTSKSPATTTPKLSPTLTTTTKYIAPATMVQSRLPTTIPTTLASTTTPPSTTIQTTTNSEVMSTLSNELAQAPLKIAASLKEPEQNVFEKVPLMPSTIRETTVTTEGTTRWEQISNATGGSSKATATEVASTLPGSTMETTDLPTTLNRVFIINNSEPQTMRTPLRPTDRQPTTETQTQTTSFGRMTTARAEPSPTTVEVPTVISTTSADTQSTVTEPPSMTTFKDQVLEAGISAVASILLDEKITGGKSPLPGRLTTPESSPTAEITSTSSIDTTITEGPSFREEGEEKSPATTAKPSESELSTMTTDRASATLALTEIVDSTTSTTTFDALTTSAVPTVTAPATIPSATIVIQTTPSVTAFITNPTIAAATVTTDITTMVTEPPKATKTPNVERTDSTTGRVEPATQSSKPKLPIKESKLNPESDAEVEAQEHNSSTEGTTMVMEQVKLTEKNPIPAGSAAPPPPPPALKTPYQENKIPPPAFKRPAVVEGSSPPAIELHPPPYESMGAEASTAFLAEDVRRFADLCNELAFRLWTAVTSKGQISSRSLVMSPFAAISLLAMVFLGARGATSGQMNEILRLDDMVTFNPHQVLQNVTDSVINSKNHGVSTAAFVRELYSDKVV
ncbi:SERPIN [Nesidiocoris tenuis]|uniref:SERPIN n=1 Tax=Nesidiocoris tenuis TaxID=355587 RepID=A0ABN7BD30_9HEMI|nr:SERPIN [Nesidiocoris tenuis]